MKFKDITKYFSLFIFAVAVIAVYKTFDNLNYIWDYIAGILSLTTPFFIGFGIAYVLLRPCRFVEKLILKQNNQFLIKNRRGIAVASIYVLSLIIIALVLVAIIPSLISSLTEFYIQLPNLIGDFVNWFNSLDLGFTLGDDTIQKLFDNDFFSVQKLITYLNFDNVNKYAQSVMNVGSGLFRVFMGIIISIYILIDRTNLKESIRRFVRSLLKEKTRIFIAKYLRLINEFANKYIYCMLVDAIIIFIASFIILSVERVKYAPMLALMLGSFNLIPYFGAILATTLTGIITVFTGSLTLAIVAVVSLVILQQIDANYIQPRLLSGSLQVKPFWVIFGALVGGGLFGIVGFFLAVPLTALFRSMLIDFMDYREVKTAAEAYTTPENVLNKKSSKIIINDDTPKK